MRSFLSGRESKLILCGRWKLGCADCRAGERRLYGGLSICRGRGGSDALPKFALLREGKLILWAHCAQSPAYLHMHTMWNAVNVITLLCQQSSEVEWMLKNWSHESVTFGLSKKELILFNSGPKVIVIHDSSYWALIPPLNFVFDGGCMHHQYSALCVWGYARVWLCNELPGMAGTGGEG